MNLYDRVFDDGDANVADILFGLLSVGEDDPVSDTDFHRFRGIYASDGSIIVRTRGGGGNREEYFSEWVVEHPLYDYDVDDSFDDTYAMIVFRPPPGSEDLVRRMDSDQIPSIDEWKEYFKRVSL